MFFISSVSSLSFIFLFLPCPTFLSVILSLLFFSPFLWETTQNDLQGSISGAMLLEGENFIVCYSLYGIP